MPPACRPQGLRHRRLTSSSYRESQVQLPACTTASLVLSAGAGCHGRDGAGQGRGERRGKHRQGWGCLSQVRADVPRGHRLDSQALTTTSGAGATSVSLREGQARWKECGGQPRAGGAGAPWVQLMAWERDRDADRRPPPPAGGTVRRGPPGEHGTQNVASLSDTDPRPGESLAHGAARGPGSCTDAAGPHPGQQPPPARSTEREGAGRPWLHRPAGRQPHHGHVHDTDTERDSHMLSQKETGDCSDTALRTACYAWAAGGRGRLQFMAGGAAAGRRPVLSSQLLWPN